MTEATYENYRLAIKLLKEEGVYKLYKIFADEKISLATMMIILNTDKIKDELERKFDATKTQTELAEIVGVHKVIMGRLLSPEQKAKIEAHKKLKRKSLNNPANLSLRAGSAFSVLVFFVGFLCLVYFIRLK